MRLSVAAMVLMMALAVLAALVFWAAWGPHVGATAPIVYVTLGLADAALFVAWLRLTRKTPADR